MINSHPHLSGMSAQVFIGGIVMTQPGLTPASLLNPMPSITNSVPTVVGPDCTGINQWINDNPLMAVGILAGLAFLMLGGKGKHAK